MENMSSLLLDTKHCGEAVWLQVQTGGHPTAGPLENPSTLSSFKTLLLSLGFPQVSLLGQSAPLISASMRLLLRFSASPSARPPSMGGACRGLKRVSLIGAVPGQWPMHRDELTPPTDPEGPQRSLSSTPHFTDGDPEFQRELGRKCRQQRFVLIPFIVLHPSHSPDLVFRQSWAGLGSWG